jgi:hypothetical protein
MVGASEADPVEISETVIDLESETTYYYCAIGENEGGVSFGEVASFTTGQAITAPRVRPRRFFLAAPPTFPLPENAEKGGAFYPTPILSSLRQMVTRKQPETTQQMRLSHGRNLPVC